MTASPLRRAPEGIPPGIWVYLACEDNPRHCTGRRLVRYGLAREMTARARPSAGTLVLDPFAPHCLTRRDEEGFARHGILVVDCSWNRLSHQSRFPDPPRRWIDGNPRRRLPLLLAANAQHFGHWGQLNTGEALGAAIFLLQGESRAREILMRFGFGPSFLATNGDLLEGYREAADEREIRAMEQRLFTSP